MKHEIKLMANCVVQLCRSKTFKHVLAFALRMESNLAKNKDKGGRENWLKDNPWDLVERVLDETVEVQECFTVNGAGEVGMIKTPEETAKECADLANFCMMVADVVTARAIPVLTRQDAMSANFKALYRSSEYTPAKHFQGCPANEGKPVCTCGSGRVG